MTLNQRVEFNLINANEGVPGQGKAKLRPPAPPYYPFTRGKFILGVIYGVLLWADMNAATPLGVWGRFVISLEGAGPIRNQLLNQLCRRGREGPILDHQCHQGRGRLHRQVSLKVHRATQTYVRLEV